MQGEENIQALRKILDFTRMGSILLLLIHFYSTCYPAIREWHLTFPIADKVIFNLTTNISLLSGINKPKLAALVLLAISLIGIRGKKNDKLTLPPILYYIII